MDAAKTLTMSKEVELPVREAAPAPRRSSGAALMQPGDVHHGDGGWRTIFRPAGRLQLLRALLLFDAVLGWRYAIYAAGLAGVLGRAFIMLPAAAALLLSGTANTLEACALLGAGRKQSGSGRGVDLRPLDERASRLRAFLRAWLVLLLPLLIGEGILASFLGAATELFFGPDNVLHPYYNDTYTGIIALNVVTALSMASKLLVLALLVTHGALRRAVFCACFSRSAAAAEAAAEGAAAAVPPPSSRRQRVFGWLNAVVQLGVGLVLVIQSAASACGAFAPARPSTHVDGACDPLNDGQCLLPWPSTYWTQPDKATATGQRLHVTDDALAELRLGRRMSAHFVHELDGFSTIAPIMFFFEGLSDDNLLKAGDDWLLPNVTTVLLNADTGQRMPHFLRVEQGGLAMMQPSSPLQHGTRYVVAVRQLRDGDDKLVKPSPAWRALRSGTSKDSARQAHFDAHVLPAVRAAGWQLDDVQLAWDFVTISFDAGVSRMIAMRDIGLQAVMAEAADDLITVDRVDDFGMDACDDPDGRGMYRRIWGSIRGPLFLSADAPDSMLPHNNATYGWTPQLRPENTSVNFLLVLSCAAAAQAKASGAPSPLFQYGHGLLGSRGEADASFVMRQANALGRNVLAVDWRGMSTPDLLPITRVLLSNPERFPIVPEGTMQGYVDAIITLRVISRWAGDQLRLDSSDASSPLLLTGDDAVFYGYSQGAVLGGGLVTLAPDVRRAVLGVPGSPFGFLAQTSKDFEPYSFLLGLTFWNQRDVRVYLSIAQQLWDSGESGGYLASFNNIPGAPSDKAVLLYGALRDPEVDARGAQIMARAYNATLVMPAAQAVPGVRVGVPPLHNVSALIQWDYEEPVTNWPDYGNNVHFCPRLQPEMVAAMRDFFADGTIRSYCGTRDAVSTPDELDCGQVQLQACRTSSCDNAQLIVPPSLAQCGL
eukprot:PLAT11266.1.p1 GENE.PLAT11266.1~~PLAT11266.1.p1  ORF type:complete len:939 (+),score=534.01 PLAT11266.1:200-3016(+)